jgi:hypothetical protein
MMIATIAGIPTHRSRPIAASLPFGSRAGKVFMPQSGAKNFPVTVTQLPTTRCEICQRTVAFRPGGASAALTKHYELRHKDKMGLSVAEAE